MASTTTLNDSSVQYVLVQNKAENIISDHKERPYSEKNKANRYNDNRIISTMDKIERPMREIERIRENLRVHQIITSQNEFYSDKIAALNRTEKTKEIDYDLSVKNEIDQQKEEVEHIKEVINENEKKIVTTEVDWNKVQNERYKQKIKDDVLKESINSKIVA